MIETSPCPNCGNDHLFEHEGVPSGGGYAPNYLPGLGGFFQSANFVLVVCEDCGLTRFFATPEATAKLSMSSKWNRI